MTIARLERIEIVRDYEVQIRFTSASGSICG